MFTHKVIELRKCVCHLKYSLPEAKCREENWSPNRVKCTILATVRATPACEPRILFFFFFWRGSGWWTKVGKWDYNPTIDFHAYLIPKGNWTLIWSWAWPVEMLDLEWGNLKKICWEEGEEHVGSSFLAPHSQHFQLGSREGQCLQVWGESSLWFWFAVPWSLLTFGSVFLYLLTVHMSSLVKCLFRFLAHFFSHVSLFFYCVVWLLYIFWISAPYQIQDLHIFSPILFAACSFCWQFPLPDRWFSAWCGSFYLLLLLLPLLFVSNKKKSSQRSMLRSLLCFFLGVL